MENNQKQMTGRQAGGLFESLNKKYVLKADVVILDGTIMDFFKIIHAPEEEMDVSIAVAAERGTSASVIAPGAKVDPMEVLLVERIASIMQSEYSKYGRLPYADDCCDRYDSDMNRPFGTALKTYLGMMVKRINTRYFICAPQREEKRI